MELTHVMVLCKSGSGKQIVNLWQKFSDISLDRNMENMFSISFRTCHDKKRKQLVYFDHHHGNSLCLRHCYVNSLC